MKGSMRVAMAIGVGYLLGRRRKLRTATVMAVVAAVGGTSVGRIALRRGAKLLANSGVLDKMPAQVADLVDVVRGDLVDAGKAAATAAVASKIDSLTDSLHERAERIRNPEATVAEAAGAATGAARDTGKAAASAARDTGKAATGAARGAASGATRRLRGRGSDREPVDEESYPEDEYAAEDEYEDRDEAAEDEESEEQPTVPAQRTTGRRRPTAYRTRR